MTAKAQGDGLGPVPFHATSRMGVGIYQTGPEATSMASISNAFRRVKVQAERDTCSVTLSWQRGDTGSAVVSGMYGIRGVNREGVDEGVTVANLMAACEDRNDEAQDEARRLRGIRSGSLDAAGAPVTPKTNLTAK